MGAKHTPGPWIHETGVDAPVGSVVDSTGEPIAQTQENSTVGRNEDGGRAMHRMRNANARLIAAAPDLLEALEELQEFTEQFCMPSIGDPEEGSTAWKVRNAIAKAKGESA